MTVATISSTQCTDGDSLAALKHKMATMTDVIAASNILSWDQATNLPDAGGEARGRQMGTLNKISHEMILARDVGELIDRLSLWADAAPRESYDAAFVRQARRLRQRAIKIPAKLVSELAEHGSQIYTAWTVARPKNDFQTMRPLLERSVELSRQYAACFPEAKHPVDAMIDTIDRGMTAATIKVLFAKLRNELVPLVKRVKTLVDSGRQIDDRCLQGHFEPHHQLEFCKVIAAKMGFDFKKGRMDLSPHPFMTRLSGQDFRITTRARADDMTDCLFSVIHETGHALYEMGIDSALDGNLLGEGVTAGVHESQSRLWENFVGRGRPFWKYFYPVLQERFPHFKTVDFESFYRAINKVEPGLIRVDADELTYNLHVMIRFDIECQLLDGSLKIVDLPDVWNQRYREDLGVNVPSDKDGCMQDVHWFGGLIGGYFQGYTIGNILSAQIFDAANAANPNLGQEFAQGEFSSLRTWLVDNLHHWGSVLDPNVLMTKCTGSELSTESYIKYLTKKYGELY